MLSTRRFRLTGANAPVVTTTLYIIQRSKVSKFKMLQKDVFLKKVDDNFLIISFLLQAATESGGRPLNLGSR